MKIILIAYLISLSGINGMGTFYPQEKALKILEKTLKSKDLEITGKFELSTSPDDGNPLLVYSFTWQKENINYYAAFTQSKGRYELFDYLIILKEDLKIMQVKIIKYRSEHGGEIASKRWLKQFTGYTGGILTYGEDISAISGATISASSITHDIPVIMNILREHLHRD